MDAYTEKPRAIKQLEENEAALAALLGVEEAPYTPPTSNFYLSNYPLDGFRAADIWSSHGYFRNSAKQLNSFRAVQRGDGMVPNMQFPPQKITLNPERWTFTSPMESSDYTQSPDWAYSVHFLYQNARQLECIRPDQSINPDAFLQDIYPSLDAFYGYFIKYRRNSADDPLVFNIHPHETNRDSGPEFDDWKARELSRLTSIPLKRISRIGEREPFIVNQYNRAIDYLGGLAINIRGRKQGWDPAKIHKQYEFNDVWYNCILANNFYHMQKLAEYLQKEDEAEKYGQLADELEDAILEKMYFKSGNNTDGEGEFYSIFNGEPVPKTTISNLMVLLLRKLEPRHHESTLNTMDTRFNTPFPLPTVATDDTANFDPHYEESDRHWRTPKWIVADDLAIRGLNLQLLRNGVIERLRTRSASWRDRIRVSNLAVVEEVENDYFEHHNPITGKGQRGHRTKGHIFDVTAHIRYTEPVLKAILQS